MRAASPERELCWAVVEETRGPSGGLQMYWFESYSQARSLADSLESDGERGVYVLHLRFVSERNGSGARTRSK